MYSLIVSVNRSISNHKMCIFICWIWAFLSWLFWFNTASKVMVLLQVTSVHLCLFCEFLGKNDSTWNDWDTSTVCQRAWNYIPAQLLRKASCLKGGFRKPKCWWTPKSAQGSPFSALRCYARRDAHCKIQYGRSWHEQMGHRHCSSPKEAWPCAKAFT